MAEINAFISVVFSKESASRFAVILKSDNEVLKRSYLVSDSKSLNYLSLLATLFAIDCITRTNVKIKLYTSNRYITSMLERDENGWLKAANTNQDIVDSIRDKLLKFISFSVELDKNSAHMIESQDLIK